MLLLLFSLLFSYHVTMTVLVTITKTGTITMTNEQLKPIVFPISILMQMLFLRHDVKTHL